MKILFILPQIPYPPHSGGRIVTWNTLKRFAQTDEVSAVCLYHHETELEYLPPVEALCQKTAVFKAHPKWSWPLLLRALFSTWPYKAHRFYNQKMAQQVRQWVREERFDVIHAQNFYTAAYVYGDEPALKIHYKENLEGFLLKRYAANCKNPLIKLAAWLEGGRTTRYERRACRKFDQVLTISPIDRNKLKTLEPALAVHHQRPGVDLSDYSFLDEPEGPPRVVFTGTMSYYPNERGVLTFLRAVWPIVRGAIPDMECWIVGAGPSHAIQGFHGKAGIHITGRVPCVQTFIERALIYIVPLQIGGGIRLKILEAMAAGRAIVSTPLGCEGLEAQDNEHWRIAEMPGPFAQAVIQLTQDETLRQRLRRNARQWVEAHYNWDTVIHQQRRHYRSHLPIQGPQGSVDC